jgi:hypothetical protein
VIRDIGPTPRKGDVHFFHQGKKSLIFFRIGYIFPIPSFPVTLNFHPAYNGITSNPVCINPGLFVFLPFDARQNIMEKKSPTEEFEVNGEKIVETVKHLVHEGNIRRITIKDTKGRSLLKIPLTYGVAGALFIPAVAALGAIAAVVTKCTIVVERMEH